MADHGSPKFTPASPMPPASDAARLMQYDAAKKSTAIAYLLWFFLGQFGVHRIYLGRIGSGIAMAIIAAISWALAIILIGWIGVGIVTIWWLVDALLIPGIATRANLDLAARLAHA